MSASRSVALSHPSSRTRRERSRSRRRRTLSAIALLNRTPRARISRPAIAQLCACAAAAEPRGARGRRSGAHRIPGPALVSAVRQSGISDGAGPGQGVLSVFVRRCPVLGARGQSDARWCSVVWVPHRIHAGSHVGQARPAEASLRRRLSTRAWCGPASGRAGSCTYASRNRWLGLAVIELAPDPRCRRSRRVQSTR